MFLYRGLKSGLPAAIAANLANNATIRDALLPDDPQLVSKTASLAISDQYTNLISTIATEVLAPRSDSDNIMVVAGWTSGLDLSIH